MPRVKAKGKALPETSENRPAGTVLLEDPIASFSIPTVNAECVIDETADVPKYRPPEQIDVVHPLTKELFKTCRVPIIQAKRLVGYIPLPLRYQQVWLELSYCIVLYTQMWRLWTMEEENSTRKARKEKTAILRQNCGALVAQHTLARLLAVDELLLLSHSEEKPGEERIRILDEWKIRWSRDWFNTTYDKVATTGAKFLAADPVNVEGDWNIDDGGKSLLSPPEDLEEWFDGEIEGLDDTFEETLKHDALAALKKPDYYTQTHHDDRAKLPARWHEGHKPAPFFWSIKQWNWIAEGADFAPCYCFSLLTALHLAGHSVWTRPVDLLFFVLTEDPLYTQFQQFLQDLNSLLNMVLDKPKFEQARVIAKQLWRGEMTWREFVDAIMTDHLSRLRNATSETSERPDPANDFYTLEARLVLEGYVRRHEADKDKKPWDKNDVILWQALSRVATRRYKSAWEWIVSQIVLGKKVSDVLTQAGPWWDKRRAAMKKAQAQNVQEEQADGDEQQASSDQADVNIPEADNAEGSGSSQEQAETGSEGAAIVDDLPPPEREGSEDDDADGAGMAFDHFQDFLRHRSIQ
ncbi:hypothetical protein BDR05DRAFT_953682, partial [Suillus weaverae]